MDIRKQLDKTIAVAKELARSQALKRLLDAQRPPVHFRPSSSGVALIGLSDDGPQLGKGGLEVGRLARDFAGLYDKHCRTRPGRPTEEKRLQSALLREAYLNDRRLVSINAASRSGGQVELKFVTDELALRAPKKIVCDILALRCDGARQRPVVLELKSSRQLARLATQVNEYSELIDQHQDRFAELYSAILDEPVRFDDPAEKWIVWPMPKSGSGEPREENLAGKGIRVAGYDKTTLRVVRLGRDPLIR